MTLKTFHFAGVASMNVTLGVPRIKEIINATDKISTPIITAKLVNEESAISARIVKGRIEKTELGDIAEYIKEVYSPNGCYLSVKLDLQAISALKIEVTTDTIRESIIKTSKLKIKEKHVSIVSHDKLHIEPYDTSREKMYFVMQ
jgi:DNA-directed RNA polymerase III subunit RPC1